MSAKSSPRGSIIVVGDSVELLAATDQTEADAAAAQTKLQQRIAQHNRHIADLKRRIGSLCEQQTTLSGVQQLQLNCMHDCLRQKMNALNADIQLMIRAVSERPDQSTVWSSIPMATTLAEDRLPSMLQHYCPPQSARAPEAETASKASRTSGDIDALGIAAETDINEQLQADIHYRDMMIECLQQKMHGLRNEIRSIYIESSACAVPCPAQPASSRKARQKSRRPCPAATARRMQANVDEASDIQTQLELMEQVLHELQTELTHPCGMPCKPRTPSPAGECGGDDDDDDSELRNQHNLLLAEYAKKDRDCKQLRDQLAKLNAAAQCDSDTATSGAQIAILQQRITELRDEREDHRVLCTEQQQQIDDYRAKFLQAQQQVCEQRSHLDEAQLGRQQIREQICEEVQRIKERFQAKLYELQPMPQLLETERFHVATLRQQNDDLTAQLAGVSAQLRKALKDLKRSGGDGDRAQSQLAKNALNNSVQQAQALAEREKKALCLQLHEVQQQLGEARAQLEKQAVRAGQRSDGTRMTLQRRIDRLEIELAETRAKSSMRLAERDQRLGAMRTQLSEVAANFGSAQRQIVGLKRRMVGMEAAEAPIC